MGVKSSRQLLEYCKEEGNTDEEALKILNNSWFLDVNYQSDDGNTILHWACYSGKVRVVKSLLENCAQPNVLNNLGSSPLMVAVRYGNRDVVQTLVESKVDVNMLSHNGKNALTIAVCCNQYDCVSYLLSIGAEIQNCTLTQCAYLKESKKIAVLLLEKGASPNSIEDQGHLKGAPLTALMTAVIFRNMPIIKLLTQQVDLDINQQNDAGFTALHYANGVGEEQIVEYLLKMGANPNVRAADGSLPVEVAHVKLPEHYCDEGIYEGEFSGRKMDPGKRSLSRLRDSPSPRKKRRRSID